MDYFPIFDMSEAMSHFFLGLTSINPSYFGVNRRTPGFLPTAIFKIGGFHCQGRFARGVPIFPT
jgi:hypothetical protein